MRIFKILILAIVFCIGTQGRAHELNVVVEVSSSVNTQVDKAIFKDLEKSIYELLNNTKWTDDQYDDLEKIDAQVTLTVVKEIDANTFVVDLLVQSRRPIYKSNMNTTMLNYLDRGITVNFTPGQIIQRSEASYYDNLSSILTFYSYMILGYDYDSFAPLGGDVFFLKARDVLTTLPPSVSVSSGWDNRGGIVGRNRYWMQENILSPKMKPFRQFIYEYHRLGLDELYKDADRQRAVIAAGISGLQTVISDYPSSMSLQMFSDAKSSEIIDIFSVADRGQKKKVYDIMVQCDPGRASKYSELSR